MFHIIGTMDTLLSNSPHKKTLINPSLKEADCSRQRARPDGSWSTLQNTSVLVLPQLNVFSKSPCGGSQTCLYWLNVIVIM